LRYLRRLSKKYYQRSLAGGFFLKRKFSYVCRFNGASVAKEFCPISLFRFSFFAKRVLFRNRKGGKRNH
jgi:hypothetical protein